MLSQFWQQPPSHLAIKTLNGQYNYGELQEAVRVWIDFFCHNNLNSQCHGLFFENHFYADSCILAHLFSGKPFVPIAAGWTNAAKTTVSSQLGLQGFFHDQDAIEIFNLKKQRSHQGDQMPLLQIPKKGLMSFMMTSGSTGTSKAVGIEFEQFSALLEYLFTEFQIQSGTRVAQCFSPVFDPYYAMMALTYGQGGVLHFLDRSQHYQLQDFCIEHKIEILACVPTLAEMNLRNLDNVCSSIKRTLFTGESLKKSTICRWIDFAPKSTVENLYGPVETTVWVTHYKVDTQKEIPAEIPLGAPFGKNVLSLNGDYLIIEGPQVARGYYQNKEWISFNGQFQTRDRACTDELGQYIFLGREDSLLKVSGERIDLEDIENEINLKFKVGCMLVWSEANHGLNLIHLEQDLINDSLIFLDLILPNRFKIKTVLSIPVWPLTDSGKKDRKKVRQLVEGKI